MKIGVVWIKEQEKTGETHLLMCLDKFFKLVKNKKRNSKKEKKDSSAQNRKKDKRRLK